VSKRSIIAPALLLAIVLVAALALFLTHRDTPPRSEAAAPPAHIETASEPVAENVVATEPAARETVTAAPGATPPAPAPGTASTDATLVVHVVAKETGSPIRSIHVYLLPKAFEERFAATQVDQSRGTIRQGLKADDAGVVEFAAPPAKDLLLSTPGNTTNVGSAEQDIAPLRPSERREVRFELPTQSDLTFHGRVVSSVARSPLVGAHIQAVSADRSFVSSGSEPGHEEWSRTKLGEVTSDSDGLFELVLAKWKSPHLRVEADGYALALVIPTNGHETRDTARTIELDPAASLRIRILDASGAPIAGARVMLETPGYSFNRSEERVLMWGFASLPPERWKAESAPDGRCELTKLPPGIAITLEVLQNGTVIRREAEPLTLMPGEERELEFRIGSGCTLNGLVLDQDGHPIGMHEVWMQKFQFEGDTYFEPYSAKDVVAKATTDAQGQFVLKDVPAGKWRIGPAAVRNQWDPPKEDALAPLGEVVDVGDGPSQDVTLHVYRGLYIRGLVVAPNGDAVSRSSVSGGQNEHLLMLSTNSGKDGTFALGPLAPGTYFLIARGWEGHAPSEPVRAEAGQRDVSIRLRAGGSLSGRVVDARSEAGCASELTITPQHPAGAFGRGMTTSTNPDSSFEIGGLEPGSYGIAAITADGRFGVLPAVSVAPDAKSENLVISVSLGGKLRLRYEGAKEHVFIQVMSRAVPVEFPEPVQRGKTLEKRAPQGALVLNVMFEWTGEPLTMQIDLAAGEEKDVVIHDKK
jgi:protocatechuate 3,4-dioxygenase beta subunit